MTTSHQTAGLVPHWTISDRIRKAREVAGLRQPELAEAIGVSRATLANTEQGTRDPRRGELIAIAFATGTDFRWLETGETPAGPRPDGGEMLPLLDSNQQPFGYTDGDTSPIPWPAVSRLPCVA